MIELAEVIRQLRGELDLARRAADGEELQFELGPVELEVTVGLQLEAGAGAKVRFWVVELGGDARTGSASTQRIKLTLQPTLVGAAGRVYVSGEEVAGER
ncbi:MAG: trypco2 family protein [Streptosporangiaceae bacterium]|jgi:hypothetical protein